MAAEVCIEGCIEVLRPGAGDLALLINTALVFVRLNVSLRVLDAGTLYT